MLAPPDSPSVNGSANGFRKTACRISPASDKLPPMVMAVIIRWKRSMNSGRRDSKSWMKAIGEYHLAPQQIPRTSRAMFNRMATMSRRRMTAGSYGFLSCSARSL